MGTHRRDVSDLIIHFHDPAYCCLGNFQVSVSYLLLFRHYSLFVIMID